MQKQVRDLQACNYWYPLTLDLDKQLRACRPWALLHKHRSWGTLPAPIYLSSLPMACITDDRADHVPFRVPLEISDSIMPLIISTTRPPPSVKLRWETIPESPIELSYSLPTSNPSIQDPYVNVHPKPFDDGTENNACCILRLDLRF
jgi:hypothetical protein